MKFSYSYAVRPQQRAGGIYSFPRPNTKDLDFITGIIKQVWGQPDLVFKVDFESSIHN